ncbi:MAG: hypothetical protein K2Y18_03355 [Alphaproteobacteria bacterium]|jgi:hypothetical protein|nr:hypothetical protein [Alphaproteobacteria bacterium]
MDRDANSSDGNKLVLSEVPGSVQTWESINPAFEDLVSCCDSSIFSKQFVAYAKRDWQSLKSVDPACYDLESPQATRLSLTQYYNKALQIFKLDSQVTRDRLNACFSDMTILDKSNHFFDQVLVIWCDLLPQIDELSGHRKHTLPYEDKRKLMRAAWAIPAPQIMSRMKIIIEVRKEFDGEGVTSIVLSTPSEEIRGRMRLIKDLKPSLFPKESPYYLDKIMKELFNYSKGHLEVFQELLHLAGFSPNRPFYSDQKNEERALTWLGDWISKGLEELKKMPEIYKTLLLGMDESQLRDIQRHLPNWTPGQVRTFVNTVVVPFLHQTYKDDFGFEVEVGMKSEERYRVVLVALENHKEDIQFWCEEAEEHFEALLLPAMVQPGHLSLATMDYIKDVLGTALLLKPNTLQFHCKKLKDKAHVLFREKMNLREKIGIIIAILAEENTRILNKRLEILEGFLAKQEWVGQGMDAHHQRLVHSLLCMPYPYIDKITPSWNVVCHKLPNLKERADFVEEVAASPSLNALEILLLQKLGRSEGEKVGNIQAE